MLQQVVLESANPMTLEIGNADPNEILILTSISGLSPVDVQLFTGEFARSGGYYQGRRVGMRNPVFNFKLNPNYALDIDVSDIRDLLYRQFLEPTANGDGLQVRLVDDRRPDRYFIGFTEKFPTEIFVKEPTAQISMLCVDPFLKSVDEISRSQIGGWLTLPINYDGSADTGIELTIQVVGATPQITIENNNQTMILDYPFLLGDEVTINTIEGSRYIRRNGVDIMVALRAGSDWIQLTQASNLLQIYGENPSDAFASIREYTYRSEWWGI